MTIGLLYYIYEFDSKLDPVRIAHFSFVLPDVPGQKRIQFQSGTKVDPHKGDKEFASSGTQVTNSL